MTLREHLGIRLIVRYYLIYHPHSPIKLGVVFFPGQTTPQRGIVARVPILEGTYLLEAGGIVSNDSPTRKISGFSAIMHKGDRSASKRLLVGPIRFANHHCRPNCQVSINYSVKVYVLTLIDVAVEYSRHRKTRHVGFQLLYTSSSP